GGGLERASEGLAHALAHHLPLGLGDVLAFVSPADELGPACGHGSVSPGREVGRREQPKAPLFLRPIAPTRGAGTAALAREPCAAVGAPLPANPTLEIASAARAVGGWPGWRSRSPRPLERNPTPEEVSWFAASPPCWY